jgi:hypothetical protein
LWRDPEGGELYSFTIITTGANKLLRPIHNRMPVILEPLAAKQWLDPIFTSLRTLSFLLQPFPSELMEAYEVSRLVNDPKNDSPACIEPAAHLDKDLPLFRPNNNIGERVRSRNTAPWLFLFTSSHQRGLSLPKVR